MIFFPNLPEGVYDGCGHLCIPEELSLPEESENDSVDAFVQALIECMSKPLKGGTHG